MSHRFRSIASFGVCLAAVVVASGCVTMRASTPVLAPAPLPTYTVGDSFRFTRGRSEAVAEVGADTVVWANRAGDRMTRNRNFIVTGPEWRAVPGYRASDRRGPDALWPLQVGKSARFVTVSGAGNQTWRCSVTGTRQASVPAGTFDVFRVRCVSGARPGPVYEHVWYYAPDVGHYVVYVFKRDGRVRERSDLIAKNPDFAALGEPGRATVDRVFQTALESSLSGVAVGESLNGGGAVSVMPSGTFRDAKSGFCRTYRLTLGIAGNTRAFPGIACRGEDGIWREPIG